MSKRRKTSNGTGQYSTISPAAMRILAINNKPQYMPRTPRGAPPRFQKGFDRTAGFYGRYAPLNPQSAEMKFHDVDIDQIPIAIAGNIVNGGTVIIIPQGVTESQRVGRKCTLKSINWRFTIRLAEVLELATPPNPDVVRVIVYQDKQCNGATATVTDILQSADYQSFNNLSNKTRFRTLMDRTYEMNFKSLTADAATSYASNSQLVDDSFFKNCNIPIEYSATTGAIAEIASNNIGMLFISLLGASELVSKLRVRFHDY